MELGYISVSEHSKLTKPFSSPLAATATPKTWKGWGLLPYSIYLKTCIILLLLAFKGGTWGIFSAKEYFILVFYHPIFLDVQGSLNEGGGVSFHLSLQNQTMK